MHLQSDSNFPKLIWWSNIPLYPHSGYKSTYLPLISSIPNLLMLQWCKDVNKNSHLFRGFHGFSQDFHGFSHRICWWNRSFPSHFPAWDSHCQAEGLAFAGNAARPLGQRSSRAPSPGVVYPLVMTSSLPWNITIYSGFFHLKSF